MSTREPSRTGRRFAVVGGGISGIAAAHRLHGAGHEVELVEAEHVLGGRMGFDSLGDRAIMMGGKNIGRRYTRLRAFVDESGGAEYEPFGINSSQVVDGTVRTLDDPGVLGLVRYLASVGRRSDIARMLYYGVQVKLAERNRYLGAPFFTRTAAARDHEPITRYFGSGLCAGVLRPMTLRLNAAEPGEIYLGTFGVHLGMVMDRYDQLVHGFQPIVEVLARKITVRLATEVVRVVRQENRVTGLEFSHGPGATTLRDYDGVVLATPAAAAARILADDLPAASALLREVAYFPSTVAVVEYDREIFGTRIRSLAFDSGPCSAAGVYGIADRHLVRYTFSGAAARPVPSDATLAEWIDTAEKQVHHLLGTPPAQRLRIRTRSWPAAHCAYVPDHGRFLQRLGTHIRAVPGLELAGDYHRGAQLEACFRAGTEAAERLVAG